MPLRPTLRRVMSRRSRRRSGRRVRSKLRRGVSFSVTVPSKLPLATSPAAALLGSGDLLASS